MNSELIPFITENNNRYFYDPRIREIFIFSEEMDGVRKCESFRCFGYFHLDLFHILI